MKAKEKICIAVLGTLIFFLSGGLACTYGSTGTVSPVLAVLLGFMIFIAAGGAACKLGNQRIAKQKEKQIAK